MSIYNFSIVSADLSLYVVMCICTYVYRKIMYRNLENLLEESATRLRNKRLRNKVVNIRRSDLCFSRFRL